MVCARPSEIDAYNYLRYAISVLATRVPTKSRARDSICDIFVYNMYVKQYI